MLGGVFSTPSIRHLEHNVFYDNNVSESNNEVEATSRYTKPINSEWYVHWDSIKSEIAFIVLRIH